MIFFLIRELWQGPDPALVELKREGVSEIAHSKMVLLVLNAMPCIFVQIMSYLVFKAPELYV